MKCDGAKEQWKQNLSKGEQEFFQDISWFEAMASGV